MSEIKTAPIKWAQRSDSLYLTIALPDVKDETITLTDSELKFNGSSQDKTYQLNIEFFKGVDSKGSTYKVLPRNIQMHILKTTEDNEGFWPRLLKDKVLEKNQVTIDWDRYVDEDEEKDAGGFDLSNLDGGSSMDMDALMKNMGGLGGGGYGGGDMNFDDIGDYDDNAKDDDPDDEEELPDLEQA